jgi:hypothetical protein
MEKMFQTTNQYMYITILANYLQPALALYQATVRSVARHRSAHEGEGEDADLAPTYLCRDSTNPPWAYGQPTESKNHSYIYIYTGWWF